MPASTSPVHARSRALPAGKSAWAKSLEPGLWRLWAMVVGAIIIPVSLLWDYSWECTVGIDAPLAPPHLATYLGVLLVGAAGLSAIRRGKDAAAQFVAIGKLSAPAGAWIASWGAFAYAVAFGFDRWWQETYGLLAGIWHPPQILKALSFLAINLGALVFAFGNRGEASRKVASALAVGAMLTLLSVITLAESLPNQQHSPRFYLIACAIYPAALLIAAKAGQEQRSGAASAALVYTGLVAALVWILPLIPATPAMSPIYNPRDHLMPPPFPLLLIAPALAIDWLARGRLSRRGTRIEMSSWEAGFAFFALFMLVQWPFAGFLISPAADNAFFAGGGRHWPFFLKIDASARTSFWRMPSDELTLAKGIMTAAIAVISARLGIVTSNWLRKVMR